MSHLESGTYGIAAVTFAFGEPVSRPLGVGGDSKVVILPEGYPPQKWEIKQIGEGDYLVRILGNRYAKAEDDSSVRVIEEDPYPWHIIRGAPCPEPIGKDNFGIFVPGHPRPQQCWTFPEINPGNAPVEIPIFIGEEGAAIHIFRLHD